MDCTIHHLWQKGSLSWAMLCPTLPDKWYPTMNRPCCEVNVLWHVHPYTIVLTYPYGGLELHSFVASVHVRNPVPVPWLATSSDRWSKRQPWSASAIDPRCRHVRSDNHCTAWSRSSPKWMVIIIMVVVIIHSDQYDQWWLKMAILQAYDDSWRSIIPFFYIIVSTVIILWSMGVMYEFIVCRCLEPMSSCCINSSYHQQMTCSLSSDIERMTFRNTEGHEGSLQD